MTSTTMQTRTVALAIDFDGTIVECNFPEIGEDLGGLFWLAQVKMMGCELIIWTSRHGDELELAKRWLTAHGYDDIITGINVKAESSIFDSDPRKIGVDIYVDEKGLGAPVIRYTGKNRKPHYDWQKAGPMLMREVSLIQREWIMYGGSE